MNDNTRIKKAHHEGSDTEQPLVGGNKIQKDSVSDAEFCLSEMKKISQLIETVSQPTDSPFKCSQKMSPFVSILFTRF